MKLNEHRMKLIRIASHLEDKIDELLIVVPDDFNMDRVLDDAREQGIPEPTIIAIADVVLQSGEFDKYRCFLG